MHNQKIHHFFEISYGAMCPNLTGTYIAAEVLAPGYTLLNESEEVDPV